jgi:chemotaxis protein methyltransferase CheR
MVAGFLHFQGVKDRPTRSPVSPPVYPMCHCESACTDNIEDFFRELFERAGLCAANYRGSALRRRVPACLRFLRVADLDAARSKLATRPELVTDLLDVALLGVTDFFRDQPVFDQLREAVVPCLLHLDRRPRIWSAGCSDGQELYSIAMLLQEAGVAEAELLGTDCRAAAIRLARDGKFPVQTLAKLPAPWQPRFARVGSCIRVPDYLRRGMRWKQADLLTTIEAGPWDLILWRNMAIYLHPDVVERVWRNLVEELSPNGCIVGGQADHVPRGHSLERIGRNIHRRPRLT